MLRGATVTLESCFSLIHPNPKIYVDATVERVSKLIHTPSKSIILPGHRSVLWGYRILWPGSWLLRIADSAKKRG